MSLRAFSSFLFPVAGGGSPSQTRGSTCPPLRRKSSLAPEPARQPSTGEMRPRGLLRAHGVAVPQRQPLGTPSSPNGLPFNCSIHLYIRAFISSRWNNICLYICVSYYVKEGNDASHRLDKNLGAREKSRLRARSEHSRLGRVGRALVTPQR